MGWGGTEPPKLKIPYYPRDEGNKGYYPFTIADKMVDDYIGASFAEVQELMYDEYLLFLRDAIIHNQMQTEEGREYLEECWRLQQTEPDREGLKGRFWKKTK